jgi:hypothetical protein
MGFGLIFIIVVLIMIAFLSYMFFYIDGDEVEDKTEFFLVFLIPLGVILILARRKWKELSAEDERKK